MRLLETRLTYSFKDKHLLEVVLTRPSAIHERLAFLPDQPISFSRVKFIGCRVLGLLVSDLLFSTDCFPSEGSLTEAQSRILRHDGLIIEAAKRLKLEEMLSVGRGEAINRFNANNRVLLSHMEALFGAIWLDSGENYTTVQNCFLESFSFKFSQIKSQYLIDFPVGIMPPSNFLYLQSKLNYQFDDVNFLLNACVRQSALEEKFVDAKASFQTLEFLGDRVLNCIIADWLLKQLADKEADAFLSPTFDSLISNATLLPDIAKDIKLGQALFIGCGEEKIGVRQNSKQLADHMEAVIAAIWLDLQGDYQKTYLLISRLFEGKLRQLLSQRKELQQFTTSQCTLLTLFNPQLPDTKAAYFQHFPKLHDQANPLAKKTLATKTSSYADALRNPPPPQLSKPLSAAEIKASFFERPKEPPADRKPFKTPSISPNLTDFNEFPKLGH